MRKAKHIGIFFLLSLVSFWKLSDWCVKIRNLIFSDHQLRHSDLSGHTQEKTKSGQKKKIVSQDLGSILKGHKKRKPALSLGQICLSWPFSEGLKAHIFTEPVICTFFLRNVRTAGFQILQLLCPFQEVSINYF